MEERTLDMLPSVDLGANEHHIETESSPNQGLATTIKVKPMYQISGNGCQCLGFMQYKLDGFDAASYMEMLGNPETMQAIKEIYYTSKEPREEISPTEHVELPLEY